MEGYKLPDETYLNCSRSQSINPSCRTSYRPRIVYRSGSSPNNRGESAGDESVRKIGRRKSERPRIIRNVSCFKNTSDRYEYDARQWYGSRRTKYLRLLWFYN